MLCSRETKDPLLQELVTSYSMNLIIPPAPDVEPGDLVIAGKTSAARKVDWKAVTGIAPTIESGAHKAPKSLTFKVSRRMDVKAGAKLTGRILQALGVTAGKVETAFSKTAASTLHIDIIAPSQKTLVNLDGILGELTAAKAVVEDIYAESDLFIVTRTYRARGLRIALFDKDDALVKATAAVTDELKANANLGISGDQDGTYAFRSPEEPLVFGIMLRKLLIREGTASEVAPTSYVSLRDEGPPGDFIEEEDAFLTFTTAAGNNSARS